MPPLRRLAPGGTAGTLAGTAAASPPFSREWAVPEGMAMLRACGAPARQHVPAGDLACRLPGAVLRYARAVWPLMSTNFSSIKCTFFPKSIPRKSLTLAIPSQPAWPRGPGCTLLYPSPLPLCGHPLLQSPHVPHSPPPRGPLGRPPCKRSRPTGEACCAPMCLPSWPRCAVHQTAAAGQWRRQRRRRSGTAPAPGWAAGTPGASTWRAPARRRCLCCAARAAGGRGRRAWGKRFGVCVVCCSNGAVSAHNSGCKPALS